MIIVIISTAAVLVSMGCLAVFETLLLLGGAALLGGLTVAAGTRATSLRRLLRVLFLSASNV